MIELKINNDPVRIIGDLFCLGFSISDSIPDYIEFSTKGKQTQFDKKKNYEVEIISNNYNLKCLCYIQPQYKFDIFNNIFIYRLKIISKKD